MKRFYNEQENAINNFLSMQRTCNFFNYNFFSVVSTDI